MRCDTLIKYAFPLINHPREQKFRKLDESNVEMSNCNNHLRSTSSFFPFQSTFLGLGNWITRSRIFPTSRPHVRVTTVEYFCKILNKECCDCPDALYATTREKCQNNFCHRTLFYSPTYFQLCLLHSTSRAAADPFVLIHSVELGCSIGVTNISHIVHCWNAYSVPCPSVIWVVKSNYQYRDHRSSSGALGN